MFVCFYKKRLFSASNKTLISDVVTPLSLYPLPPFFRKEEWSNPAMCLLKVAKKVSLRRLMLNHDTDTFSTPPRPFGIKTGSLILSHYWTKPWKDRSEEEGKSAEGKQPLLSKKWGLSSSAWFRSADSLEWIWDSGYTFVIADFVIKLIE